MRHIFRKSDYNAVIFVRPGVNMKAVFLLIVIAISSAVYGQHQHGPSTTKASKPPVWLDNGLGNVDHPVTTRSADAQKYFNQGLAYIYAFNHAEGINSFRQAAELDPDMAMAFWGISLALGSNYNVTADESSLAEAYANLQKAIALASKASPAERDYITALSKRYAQDPKTDRVRLAGDYKNAMGDLAKKYPEKLKELKALFDEEATRNRLYPLITWDDVIDKIRKGVPMPRPSSEPVSSNNK